MIKAIFFDLDGTLLPMNEELFTKKYFSLLCNKFPNYEKEKLISTIYEGTMAMYKNDGRFTNEEVFWNVFKQKYLELLEKKKMELTEKYIKAGYIYDHFFHRN